MTSLSRGAHALQGGERAQEDSLRLENCAVACLVFADELERKLRK